MRFSNTSTLIGTLGSLVQQLIAGVNALVVQCYGSIGVLAQQAVSGTNALITHSHGLPGGDDVTKAGLAFAMAGQQAAVAAQNSHVQLKNPPASTATLYVDSVEAVNTSAGVATISASFYDVDATTDAGAGFNKDDGNTGSQAHVRTQGNAGLLGNIFFQRVLQAGATTTITFSPPLRLAPGKGCAISNNAVNLLLNASFQWRELAN